MQSDGMAYAVKLTAVWHAFDVGGQSLPALRVDRLDVEAGARLAVRGPNGSGKTTLLHVIAGLLTPTRGCVEVDGVDPYALSPVARDRFRAERIGYLFQALHLVDPLTVFENVLCAVSFARTVPRA